ncbi:MAG: delta 1-pyrroline-5-carboxylate synthetase [Methylophaga sp.]|nr:delta 1-pyrroline-5-carboxylate synthetase [Methylophaga sp.]
MLTVIKLGGSLYHSQQLSDCLQHISAFAESQAVVLVAGGGPFADLVRQAQQDHGFSDKTAHQMAINAMRQFALLIIDLLPDTHIFSWSDQPLPATGLSVWLPDDSQLMAADLPQNWQVTADSLALWLTQKINASKLILIKRCAVITAQITELSAHGIVDAHFATQYQRQPLPCSIIRQVDIGDGLTRQIPMI